MLYVYIRYQMNPCKYHHGCAITVWHRFQPNPLLESLKPPTRPGRLPGLLSLVLEEARRFHLGLEDGSLREPLTCGIWTV